VGYNKGFTPDTLLELGLEAVDAMSREMVERADKLAEELDKKDTGSDRVKSGDKIADEIACGMANKFISNINLKRVYVGSTWDAIEEETKKGAGKKLVFVSEDFGVREFGNTESDEGVFIILDPLHGSNHIRPWKTPHPHAFISMALGNLSKIKKDSGLDAVEVGIVKDIFHGDTYYAVRGGGAFYKDWGNIQTSPKEDFETAMIAVDLTAIDNKFDKVEKRLHDFLRQFKFKRRLLNVPDACKVACGEYDASISLTDYMVVTDVAAIKLIVEEAGGVFDMWIVGDSKTGTLKKNFLKHLLIDKKTELMDSTHFEFIACGNEKLYKKIRKYIK